MPISNPLISFIESYWKWILIFAVYWQTVILLKQYGILERYNIDNHGPILMIRTTRGQQFLDRVASVKVFWRVFADIGIPLMLIGMFLMFALIILSDITILTQLQTQTVPPPSELHELKNIFLLPGINEFIPLVWGIIGLLVTLVVHEFSHAILSKVEDIKVKSMGLILLLVPIGGFAEPDETQLFGKSKEKEDQPDLPPANRRQRVRILSAGVMANFVTALIAFMLFFVVIGSMAPVSNVMITDVVPGSAADVSGLSEMTVVTHINDQKIENASFFYTQIESLGPDEEVRLRLKHDGTIQEKVLIPDTENMGVISGIKFENVIPGMPSDMAGLMPGMLIIGIDNTTISDMDDFLNFMVNTTPAQEIELHTLFSNEEVTYNITLGSDPNLPQGEGKGFIGISDMSTVVIARSIGISVGEFPAKELLHFLQNIPSMMKGPAGWIILLVLPFPNPIVGSFQGFSGTLSMFYIPVGWAAFMGDGVFWLANSLLWIGWLNFYVGLFNCLPMLPLDGGHVFKDTVHIILARLFGEGSRVAEMAANIATGFAILIMVSLIFMIIAPYMVHGL